MVFVGKYTIDGWYGQEISNSTHISRTPKTPEYLIHSLEGNLLNGVRWDSVSFTFTDGFLLDKMMYINSRGET